MGRWEKPLPASLNWWDSSDLVRCVTHNPSEGVPLCGPRSTFERNDVLDEFLDEGLGKGLTQIGVPAEMEEMVRDMELRMESEEELWNT